MAPYLLLELRQLAAELSHHSHRAVQLILQGAHLVLLAVPLAAHQRHSAHAREPVQVLLLRAEERQECEGEKVERGGEGEVKLN